MTTYSKSVSSTPALCSFLSGLVLLLRNKWEWGQEGERFLQAFGVNGQGAMASSGKEQKYTTFIFALIAHKIKLAVGSMWKEQIN